MSFRAYVPRHKSTVEPSRSHRSEQQLFDEPFARRLIVPRQGSSKLKRKQSTVKVGSSKLKQKKSTVGVELTRQWRLYFLSWARICLTTKPQVETQI